MGARRASCFQISRGHFLSRFLDEPRGAYTLELRRMKVNKGVKSQNNYVYLFYFFFPYQNLTVKNVIHNSRGTLALYRTQIVSLFNTSCCFNFVFHLRFDFYVVLYLKFKQVSIFFFKFSACKPAFQAF